MKLKITTTLFLIIFICFAATANQAVALKYSWVEEICPLDGTKFKAKVVTSFTRRGIRLDFKPLGHLAAPKPVAVCPTDHFVLYKSKFDQSEVSKLKEFVNSPAYQKHVLGNSSYYLMAKIFEFIEKPAGQIAYTYLKASWQVEHDPKKYNHYVSKSLEYYEKVIAQLKQQGRTAQVQIGMLSTEIICVELERRLALFDNAGKRLARVKDQFKEDMGGIFGRMIPYEMKLIEARDSDPHEIPDSPKKIDATTFYSRGRLFYSRGQYNLAIENFDNAIRLKPDYAEAFLTRGVAYIRKGFYERAIEDLDNAIRLMPNDADALYTRGQTNFHLGFFENAARDFEQALNLYSSDIFCTIWLFIARERSGQNGKQELARNVVKFDLNNWPGPVVSLFLGKVTPQQVLASVKHLDQRKQRELECEAFFYVGQYYLLLGDRGEAARLFRKTISTRISHFTEYTGAKSELDRMRSTPYRNNKSIVFLEAVETDPKYAKAYILRGDGYQRKHRYGKAISDYTKAIKLKPTDIKAYIRRGIAYQSKRQYDKAISDYTKVIEIEPRDFNTFISRGNVYFSKKDYDKAWNDFKQAQSLGARIDPEFLKMLREASGRER